jgi:methylmalonyl-CoA mutase
LKTNSDLKSTFEITREMSEKIYVIPHRTRYLSEIAESNHYDETALTQEQVAQKIIWCFQNNRNSFRKSSRYHKIRN